LEVGNRTSVNIRKIIQRRIRHQGKGVNAVGDVNAVISANGLVAHVSTRRNDQRRRRR